MRKFTVTDVAGNLPWVLDELTFHPEGIEITRRGRPVARLFPVPPTEPYRWSPAVRRCVAKIVVKLRNTENQWVPWSAARLALGNRGGATIEDIRSALREEPGIEIDLRNSEWRLRFSAPDELRYGVLDDPDSLL